MKTALLYVTKGGKRLSENIEAALHNASLHDCSNGRLLPTLRQQWLEADAIVFIMAAGIAVRTIAPLLQHKHSDPAVVVCDETGRYAISLLSGHLGGANQLAKKIARITGGHAVITTASDVLGHTSIDLWAKDLGIAFEDQKDLTYLMGKLVNRGYIEVWHDIILPSLPADMKKAASIADADLVIGYRTRDAVPGIRENACLAFAPVLCAGVGCNRGTGADAIAKALSDTCAAHDISIHSISHIASIDVKRDEKGLIEYASSTGKEIQFFNKDQLNRVKGVTSSSAAHKATGAKAVAEPAAILAAKNGKLIVRKMKWKDVTTALALDTSTWWEQDREQLTS